MAYEELQSTVEELETTNEELQSTNEELETTNEELQSTNEELETMNEELQSTNEELQTINDELRLRTRRAQRGQRFLESILASHGAGGRGARRAPGASRCGTATPRSCGACARTRRVGKHLLELDIGLPVDAAARAACATRCRRGRPRRGDARGDQPPRAPDRVHGRTLPLTVGSGDVSGVILLMEQSSAEDPS